MTTTFIFKSSSLKAGIAYAFNILMPIVDGLVVAYLLCPLVNLQEKQIYYPFLEKKKINVTDKARKLIRFGSVIISMLLVILVVYIIAFVFLVALTVKDPKKAKLPIKYYKKGLKIFKAFANVVFLVLSAVSMAGIAGGGMGIKEWIVFIATFMVAVVQLAIKVSLLVLNIVRRNLTSKYKVKVKRYVNGEEKKKKAVDVIEEKF